MTPRNEDFLFAQEAQRRGYIGEEQLEEGFLLQKRMLEELQIDERLAVILVKRGWLAEEQARRVYARIEPEGETDEIQGYRILEKIGRGAMGTVYKAVHLGLQRPVAIKILRRDLARDATQVERLKEEAKLLASLDHPNIVRAFDAGESRGFPFVVMEYVDGETLKERVSRQGPLHEIDALRITRGLADALERARRMGVVHRDVKPGNIILTRKDEPKLMDLGLAKGPVDLGLTQHGATVGTPQFISPEQAQDPRRADTRSDIYSLGATLYAMVTGRPPFTGTTLAEVLTKVLYEAPTPPRVLNKKVSPEVGYLIERMMLKDPALRYRTPSAVVHDIDEILAGRSIIPDGFTGNWEAFLLRKRIRKWTKIGVAVVVGLVLLGTGAWVAVDRIRTREARAQGAEEIRQTLLLTEVESSDSELMVREKLLEVKSAYEQWADLAPDGFEELGSHLWRLDACARRYESYARIEKRVKEFLDAGRDDLAITRLDEFLKTASGADDPVGRTAHGLRAVVVEHSAGRYEDLRNKVLRASTPTLEDLIRRQIEYEEALGQGLYETPRLRAAATEATETVKTLEGIDAALHEAESRFSREALAADLADLRFSAIAKEFWHWQTQVLATAREDWQRLEVEDWLRWDIVRPKVELRLGRFEEAVEALIAERGRDVMQEARDLHVDGRTEAATQRLHRLARAADLAGQAKVRADALELRSMIDREAELRRQSAVADLIAIEQYALQMLREGNPDGIRERVRRTLDQREATWPFRAEVRALDRLADAYETLLSAAFDGLVQGLKVEHVRLRDGTEDARWIVKDYDKAAGTVLVATTSGRPGRHRRIAEVHPETLLKWARTLADPPPLVRAVAGLAALPEEDPEDLRPLVVCLRQIVDAFGDANYTGALSESTVTWSARTSREQRNREDAAQAHFSQAQDLFNKFKEFSLAHWHLSRLLTPLNPFRFTDYFEKFEPEIVAYKEQVDKEIANHRLLESFPGTKIGLDGEMTWIHFDFENPIQLQVFKEGPGHATGRIVKYVNDSKPVTPSKTDHRFTLLWGMRGLVRGRPMQIPCIFDPAERITVEFTLHTLGSPFFFAVDIDGLQVGILSADPTSAAYAGRWKFPTDVPRLDDEAHPPRVNFYGRGRGVAFHKGRGFGDPRAWSWPEDGRGRFWARWFGSGRLGGNLFAFEPGEIYRVKVVRDQGSLTLFVNDSQIARKQVSEWARVGHYSDRNPKIRATGSGRVQVLTWTPQAIDDLRLTGYVLERYRAD